MHFSKTLGSELRCKSVGKNKLTIIFKWLYKGSSNCVFEIKDYSKSFLFYYMDIKDLLKLL